MHAQVYLCDWANLTEARSGITEFVECVYNQKRLHSSLGYMPPAEFETLHRQLHRQQKQQNDQNDQNEKDNTP